MAGFLKIGAMAWCVAVLNWLLAPVVTFVVNKLFADLSVDLEQKLKKLKVCSIPTLKVMQMAVQKQRVVPAARNMGSESDLQTLDVSIRSALYDADDVLDLVEYHRIENKLTRERSIWQQHLSNAVGACVANSKEWFGPSLAAARSRCKKELNRFNQHWRGFFAPRGTPEEQQPISPDPGEPGNSQEQQRSSIQEAWQLTDGGAEASFDSVLQRLHSCFLAIYNCCRSILSWLAGVIEFLRRYRDWSYEVVGIEHNEKYCIGLNSFQLMMHGKSLRKRMEDIDSAITVLKKSPLLNEQSSSTINVSDKESRSKRKETADMHRNIAEPVIGRQKYQGDVSKLLRTTKGPSVIVIHGIAGSGKTTLARYICDQEKKANGKYFDPIIFIQVSKTFRLRDIIINMLMEITRQDGQSSIEDLKGLDSQREELKDKLNSKLSVKVLCAELKEKLKGKRFLLVLDDLWVAGDKNEEQEMDILLDVLNAGDGGRRILVTAQKKDAAAALGACENISIREFVLDEYFSLRLEVNNIDSWETAANEIMGDLWWSYEQLSSPEIRRCFEYCSTFPRGYRFDRRKLVDIWIAQGFVKNISEEKEEPEDVGQRYFDELLAFSFFSITSDGFFRIHDLLHGFVERVAGSDFFRIGVNGSNSEQGIPPEVRHLFIETYGIGAMTKQILELENLRTLIIEEYHLDEYTDFDDVYHSPLDLVKEKLIEGIFKKMRKLRVLIININYRENREFLISESMGQMKHLRLFSFNPKFKFYGREQNSKTNLILPSTLTQLYQMQVLEFLDGVKVSFPEDLANKLIHLRRVSVTPDFPIPNIGRLTSLQWMSCFIVKEEEGYELRQLKDLNKLRDRLEILCLENVRSKDEALEANLAGKSRLTTLALDFGRSNRDVEEDAFEGLLPPKDLEVLTVCNYSGSRFPSWMLSQNPDTPNNLDGLFLERCSQLVDIPEGSELFAGLHWLKISICTWDALPDNMERLTSLKKLEIIGCDEIEFLPTLPRSLENILIVGGKKNKLWESFQDENHPNRRRIEHVSCKQFYPPIRGYGEPF